MTVSLIHGNALTLPLADQSVHLIVSSPPYFSLRAYTDDDGQRYDGQLGSEESPYHFLAALWRVLDECWRVLRDDGSCWINLGDKFAGSGGHNNGGLTGATSTLKVGERGNRAQDQTRITQSSRRQAPDRYNQNTGGLRPKSRMLLPHLFAAGCQYPWLRRAVEAEAGIAPPFGFGFVCPRWICRMDVVWSKPNGLPESVTDRVRASHEYWFHLVKSERYFSALDTIREDYLAPTATRTIAASTHAGTDGSGGVARRDAADVMNPLGKLPGSVWEVATEPLLLPDHLPQHFAAFPSEWPRRLVLGWSPSGVCVRCGEGRRPVCERTGRQVSSYAAAELGGTSTTTHRDGNGNGTRLRAANGHNMMKHETVVSGTACACPTPDDPTRPAVVLDPFGGTGTTAIVASALGRHGISVDLSADYHRIARWRDQDGGLRAKALGVDRPPRELAGQLSLLEAVS